MGEREGIQVWERERKRERRRVREDAGVGERGRKEWERE